MIRYLLSVNTTLQKQWHETNIINLIKLAEIRTNEICVRNAQVRTNGVKLLN